MGKGEEIPKTNPAEIEKLIEQIRGTNDCPASCGGRLYDLMEPTALMQRGNR